MGLQWHRESGRVKTMIRGGPKAATVRHAKILNWEVAL